MQPTKKDIRHFIKLNKAVLDGSKAAQIAVKSMMRTFPSIDQLAMEAL